MLVCSGKRDGVGLAVDLQRLIKPITEHNALRTAALFTSVLVSPAQVGYRI